MSAEEARKLACEMGGVVGISNIKPVFDWASEEWWVIFTPWYAPDRWHRIECPNMDFIKGAIEHAREINAEMRPR